MTEVNETEQANSRVPTSEEARRVVHLTTVHHPFDPRIFHKQLGSLQAAGFDAHLIAPHARAERRNGITIHPLPEPAHRAERLALQPKVFRTARFLDADLYQIHDPELLPLAFFLKTCTGALVVYDVHEDYRAKGAVLGRGLRALEGWGFRWLDHVLIAEESYRTIVDGRDVDYTYVANYVKPMEEASPKTEGEGESSSASPTRLLYTGTVANKRGLGTMVDLAAKIREQNRTETIRVVGICRHADQRAAAETRIREENLRPVLERVGWDTYVAPTAMAPHYRWADVGLALCEPHPNLVGSLLTKFYEYLHYGLPIICSDFPLWRRFVEENECGVVVPAREAGAVLEVLARWQHRPEVYETYARNARAASSKYRWEEMEDRLVQVYRSLLGVSKDGSQVGKNGEESN